MSEKDHLGNPVSIEASISEKGVSGKAKLRCVAALDRLLGSILDVPTAKLEDISGRIRALSGHKRNLISIEENAIQRAIESDEDLLRIVAKNSISKQLDHMDNKIEVVKGMIEHLPTNDENSEHPQDEEVIEEDWLDTFERYAENASTERMRDLWARVLAGEIRRPQSFSLTTLRLISELDKDIATIFGREMEYRLTHGFILRPDDSEFKGQLLIDLNFMEEVGLLQAVSPGLKQKISPDNDGILRWREGKYILVAGAENEVRFAVIRITRIGQEIARILPSPDHVEVLRRIERRIRKQVKFSQIGNIIEETNDGYYRYTITEELKKEVN